MAKLFKESGKVFDVKYDYELYLTPTKWKLQWRLHGIMESKAKIIPSPPAVSNFTGWDVKIHPIGHNPSFMSIFLFNLRKTARSAKVVFSIKNASDAFSQRSHVFEDYDAQQGRGYTEFIHRDYLDGRGSVCYYVNRTLELVVEVETPTPDLAFMMDTLPSEAFQEAPLNGHDNGDMALCVVCMERLQTSGFLHKGEAHRCVCKQCAKRLSDMHGEELKCPICGEKVDRIIYTFYQ